MTEVIRLYLPWGLSAATIYMTVLAGNKTRWAWAVGICSQVFWFAWIVSAEAWGLLPGNAALTIVYIRNHMKWAAA